MTTVKITKKDQYAALKDVIQYAEAHGYELGEGFTYEAMNTFVDHEIELLEAKAAAAKARAAQKRAEGDELREKIFNVLDDAEFMVIDEIVSAIGDPEVSRNMVTSRLGQLGHDNRVVKELITVDCGNGKTKKASAYKRV